jgi:hypothetical protein
MQILLTLLLLLQDRPAKLQVLNPSDRPPDTFPGEARFTVTVWNSGGSAAREGVVKLTLGTTLLRVRLTDAVDTGSEDTYELTVPSCPKYTTFKADAIHATDEANVPAGELTDGENVEVGDIRFVRFSDNSLRISGTARNGLKSPIHRVKVTFRVGKSDLPVDLSPMKPGEKRPFETWIPDGPEAANYTYSIGHEEIEKLEPAPAIAAPSAKRTARKAGAVAADPPKEKPKPEEKKAGAVTIEVTGLSWVDGYIMINKKFSGWTSFLRVVIKDADGKPLKATGKFTANCFEGDKQRGVVTRILKSESWGMDATKIEPKNAAPEIVAFDKGSGELWIGIIKTDSTLDGLKLDVKIDLDKQGVWEWKGLTDKYAAKAKPADKK